MDLLGQETQKKQKTNGQKIVLMLLITLIIMSIFILVMMFGLQGNKTKTLALIINGENVTIQENTIITDESGMKYISLKQISHFLGYEYLRGGFREYMENDDKCYLESKDRIIGFENNSDKIYKISQNSTTDYEYYTLKNKAIKSNGSIYIALEDLNLGCNVVCKLSDEDYKIEIDSVTQLIKNNLASFEKKGLKISEDIKNKEAIPYNMFVVSNESGKLGVVDKDANIIIGHKYQTMQFDEYSQNFIVSNENNYGVISNKGNNTILELKYQSIRIINYSPLLYEVKLNNKMGVLDETGKAIANIVYDRIGTSESNSVLIIENINNNQTGIVVCNQGKYGIIDLKTSHVILNCELERIYSKAENSGEKQYYVQINNQEIELNRYIEYVNSNRPKIN